VLDAQTDISSSGDDGRIETGCGCGLSSTLPDSSDSSSYRDDVLESLDFLDLEHVDFFELVLEACERGDFFEASSLLLLLLLPILLELLTLTLIC